MIMMKPAFLLCLSLLLMLLFPAKGASQELNMKVTVNPVTICLAFAV